MKVRKVRLTPVAIGMTAGFIPEIAVGGERSDHVGEPRLGAELLSESGKSVLTRAMAARASQPYHYIRGSRPKSLDREGPPYGARMRTK